MFAIPKLDPPIQHIECYDYLDMIDKYGNDYASLVNALMEKWKAENKNAQDVITSLLISLTQMYMIYKHDINQQ